MHGRLWSAFQGVEWASFRCIWHGTTNMSFEVFLLLSFWAAWWLIMPKREKGRRSGSRLSVWSWLGWFSQRSAGRLWTSSHGKSTGDVSGLRWVWIAWYSRNRSSLSVRVDNWLSSKGSETDIGKQCSALYNIWLTIHNIMCCEFMMLLTWFLAGTYSIETGILTCEPWLLHVMTTTLQILTQ